MKLKCNSCSKANAFFGLYCLVKAAKHHSPFTLYAISRSPIVHPVCPHLQRFCITFVIHLPSLLQSSQEKLKPCLCNFFAGGGDKGGQTRCIMGDVQVAIASVITKYANQDFIFLYLQVENVVLHFLRQNKRVLVVGSSPIRMDFQNRRKTDVGQIPLEGLISLLCAHEHCGVFCLKER